jgi:hypothetical protein
VFSTGSVEVYDVPPLAPPSPSGNIALVIPPVWDESVDEAYLLLSLAGVNFTGVLEIDPALYNYSFIVVPYDPRDENRQVTINLLRTPIAFTSGTVRIGVDSVEFGDRSEKSGIVVWRNPFYLLPGMFNVTMSFVIREYNPKVLNYFNFVYDFRDVKNYKYAGVMFTERGQIYALNCSLLEGKPTCSPPFPGVLMGSGIEVLGEHVMRVSVDTNNNKLCLALDSLNPVCFTSIYSGGPIGVRIDRFWEVNVKNALLKIQEPVYMNKKLLKEGNYTLLVLKRELNMPFESSLGKSRIIYINMQENLSDLSQIGEFIHKVLTDQQDKYLYFNIDQYMRNALIPNLATNNIIFYNVSMTSSNLLIIPQGVLRINNSFNFEVTNTSYVTVSSLSERQLNAFTDFAKVKSGIGYYVTIEVKRLQVANAKAFLFNNGSMLELKGNLTLEGEFAVIAKRPLFIAEQAKVNGVVGQSLLYPYIARDLLVRGNTTLMFLVGDSSLLYFAVNADRSKVSFIPPLDIYSERESVPLLVKHLPLSVVLTVLIIGGFKLAGLLKKSKESKKIKRIVETS